MKRFAALVLVALSLVACGNPGTTDWNTTPSGKVVDWGKRYVVVVQDADKKRVTHHTSKADARRCRKATVKRWPDCTR